MSIRDIKNRQAEEYIRQCLVNLNAGEALPPLRQMQQESQLGRNVLENAIRKLKNDKVLETRARSGIYLTERIHEESLHIIDLVACSEISYVETDNFAMELINHFLAGAARHQLTPRFHRISWYAPISEYEEIIAKYNIKNALLMMPHHNDIQKIFDQHGINYTVVLPRYYPNAGPAVIDAPELVGMQLKYLFRHGHRRIGFIHTVDLGFASLTDLLRRETFYRFMSENGLTVRPEWVIHYSQKREQLYERLDAMFASSPKPTALVVSDWFLKNVYEYMKLRQLAIGRDISIISSDGLERDDLHPKPTSVVNSTAKIMELAWNLFERCRNDPEMNSIDYIGLTIREGESVAELKEAPQTCDEI